MKYKQLIVNETFADGKLHKLLDNKKFNEKKKKLNVVTNENKRKQSPDWPKNRHHTYRRLIIGGSGSGKTNALLNLIHHQLDIDNIYLFANSPHEPKYQLLINKCEYIGLKHFKDQKAFIKYLNDLTDVCLNIDDYNPKKNVKY